MGIEQTQSYSLSSSEGGSSVSGRLIEVGVSEFNISESYAAGATNELLTFTLTVANLQSIAMYADQNMTLKTNSTSSPGNTINLKAGSPLLWSKSNGYFANPLTTNVTALYVSCTEASRLKIRGLTS